MKVLLKETIDKLGERGEIVDVAPGHARNFLLPRDLAVPATEANYRQLEIERGRLARQAERERRELDEVRNHLESTSCTIVAAASPEGRLYGSVGEREIAEALAQEGLEIDPHQVRLDEHFQEVGVHLVEIELARDLRAQTRVWIVSE
jgi:large subunit ribosomal protein L9